MANLTSCFIFEVLNPGALLRFGRNQSKGGASPPQSRDTQQQTAIINKTLFFPQSSFRERAIYKGEMN